MDLNKTPAYELVSKKELNDIRFPPATCFATKKPGPGLC